MRDAEWLRELAALMRNGHRFTEGKVHADRIERIAARLLEPIERRADALIDRAFKVVPHGLRKNAVISLLEAGCTAAEVSGITDQSLQMVEHYARGRNSLTLGRAAIIKLDAHRSKRG